MATIFVVFFSLCFPQILWNLFCKVINLIYCPSHSFYERGARPLFIRKIKKKTANSKRDIFDEKNITNDWNEREKSVGMEKKSVVWHTTFLHMRDARSLMMGFVIFIVFIYTFFFRKHIFALTPPTHACTLKAWSANLHLAFYQQQRKREWIELIKEYWKSMFGARNLQALSNSYTNEKFLISGSNRN